LASDTNSLESPSHPTQPRKKQKIPQGLRLVDILESCGQSSEDCFDVTTMQTSQGTRPNQRRRPVPERAPEVRAKREIRHMKNPQMAGENCGISRHLLHGRALLPWVAGPAFFKV